MLKFHLNLHWVFRGVWRDLKTAAPVQSIWWFVPGCRRVSWAGGLGHGNDMGYLCWFCRHYPPLFRVGNKFYLSLLYGVPVWLYNAIAIYIQYIYIYVSWSCFTNLKIAELIRGNSIKTSARSTGLSWSLSRLLQTIFRALETKIFFHVAGV